MSDIQTCKSFSVERKTGPRRGSPPAEALRLAVQLMQELTPVMPMIQTREESDLEGLRKRPKMQSFRTSARSQQRSENRS